MRSLILCTLAVVVSAADMQTADSTITAVLVYPDRAEVTRSAVLNLAAGRNEVEVRGLPVSIDVDSLRCSLGSGKGRVIDFQTDRYRSERNLRAELAELDAAHAELTQQLREREDRIVALRRRGGMLSDYRGQVLERIRHDLVSEAPPLTEWREALAFIATEAGEGQAAVRVVEREAFEIKRKIAENRERVTLLEAGDDQPEARRVRLLVDVERAGEHGLDLRYLVREGVRWGMHYDLRLDRKDRRIEVNAYVAVAQESEEDWRDAPLTFSTRRPAHGLNPPPLAGMRLGASERAPDSADAGVVSEIVPFDDAAQRTGKRAGDVVEVGVGRVERPAELRGSATRVRPGELEIRQVRDLTDELVYAGAEPTSVRADGKAVLVPLGTWRGPAQWRHECLPEMLAAVYVRADFRNPTGARLLPGPAQAYLDGRSIGQLEFDGCTESGVAQVAFGIDQEVLVQRRMDPVEQLASRDGDERVDRWRYAISTELRNVGDVARTVQVHESIPISELDHISVELGKETTRPSEQNEEQVGWTVKLAPGASQTVTLVFTITMGEAAE